MRFSAQFEASQYSEWRKKYLRYNSIKEHIDELFPLTKQRHQHSSDEIDAEIDRHVEHARTHPTTADTSTPPSTTATAATSSSSSLSSSSHPHYGAPSDSSSSSLLSLSSRGDTAMTKLLSELHKIDNFYRTVEAELDSGFRSLQAQINIINTERSRKAENGRREQRAGMKGSSSSADIHGMGNSGSGHDSAASSPVQSPTDSDSSTSSVPLPAPSALHHSYSTGTFPQRASSSAAERQKDTLQPLPSSTGTHSTISFTAASPSHQPPITTKHLPSSYSYYSHKHHLTIHANSTSNPQLANNQNTVDTHPQHSSFTSHLLHPLHPDAAHKGHPTAGTTENLSSALLPLRSTFIHLLRRMNYAHPLR